MKIYLKWSLLILGPFLLVVGGFTYYKANYGKDYTKEELEQSYNEDQVKRLQYQSALKKHQDEQWRKQQRPHLPQK